MEPFAQECSNPGFDDRWTCPGCYDDLEIKEPGNIICKKCGSSVDCKLEYQPVCKSELAESEEDE